MENNNSNFLGNVDRITQIIGDSIQYFIANVGKAGLPIISGGLYSIGIYVIFLAATDNVIMSMVAAIVFAFGLESVGFNSSKNMIRNFNPLSVILFTGYIIIGGFSLWFTDVEHSHALMTSSAFVLTAINYILYGVREKELMTQRKLDNKDTSAKDMEQLEYDRKIQEKQTRFENKLTVEKLKGLGGVKNVAPKTNNVAPKVNTTPNNSDNSTKRVPFNKLTDNDKTQMAQMTTSDIMTKYNISKRTAQRWLSTLNKEA